MEDKIPQNTKKIFVYTVLAGLFTHLYILTNKLIVSDELYNLFSKNDTTTSGRWFLKVLSAISSDYSMPWVNGMLAILAIATATCFLIQIIKLEKLSSMLLTASILVTFPTVGATLGYMFTADAYFMGLALACIAVYMADRGKKGIFVSIVLLALALGTYQANWTFALAMMYVIVLAELVESEKTLGQSMKKIIKYMFILVLSFILYYGILKIILALGKNELASYQGISGMLDFNLQRICSAGIRTYTSFLRNLTSNLPGTTFINTWGNVFLFFVMILQSGYIVIKKRSRDLPRRILFITLIFGLMPIGLNAITLLVAPNVEVHMLMIYALALYFILAIKINELFSPIIKGRTSLVLALCILILCSYQTYSGYIINNKAYLAMDLSFNKTYATALRFLSRIEEAEGYSADAKVAFIGDTSYEENAYLNSKVLLETRVHELENMTGVPLNNVCILQNTWYHFIYDYMGISLKKPTDEDMAALKETEEFKAMSAFPANGSIQEIDGVIVVKLSE